MKNVFRWLTPLSIILFTLTACTDPCEGLENASVGDEFFTITYQDANGGNYLENGTWRLPNVEVFIDSAGNADNPDFFRIRPGFEDGKFGPFPFTEDKIDPATRQPVLALIANQPVKLDFYIKKDTFGIDTLSVNYLLAQDQCHYFWSEITYTLNGEVLTQFANSQQAEIVVVE